MEQFKSGTVRLIDPMGTKTNLQVIGIAEQDTLNDLSAFFETTEAQAVTLCKPYGTIVTMEDPNANDKVNAVQIPAGTRMTFGRLLVEREKAGPIFMKGTFPVSPDEVLKIQKSLIQGGKTIGGHAIVGVDSLINVGSKVTK